MKYLLILLLTSMISISCFENNPTSTTDSKSCSDTSYIGTWKVDFGVRATYDSLGNLVGKDTTVLDAFLIFTSDSFFQYLHLPNDTVYDLARSKYTVQGTSWSIPFLDKSYSSFPTIHITYSYSVENCQLVFKSTWVANTGSIFSPGIKKMTAYTYYDRFNGTVPPSTWPRVVKYD